MPEDEEELFKDFYKEDKGGKKPKKREDGPEDIAVSFTLNKRWIERGALIAVILLLLIAYAAKDCPTDAATAAEAEEGFFSKLKSSLGIFSSLFKSSAPVNATPETVTSQPEETPKPAAPKPSATKTTTTSTTSTSTVPVKTFEADIDFVRASEADMTITQVVYEAKNKLNEEIKPLIVKIFVYDPHSTDFRTTPRSERTILGGVEAGGKLNEPPVSIFANFDNIDLLKTVKVEIYDSKNKLLDKIEKNCRIQSNACIFTS